MSLRSFVFSGRPSCFSKVSFPLFLRSSVFSGRPNCFSLLSFSLLLGSSVFSGKPFYYSYVSFSLLRVFRFQRKALLLFYFLFFTFIIILAFLSNNFCAEDFSEIAHTIYYKFPEKMYLYLNIKSFFIFLKFTSGRKSSPFDRNFDDLHVCDGTQKRLRLES